MCGGTQNPHSDVESLHGLSPRVRGNLENGDGQDEIRRSIPACAGEPRPPGRGRRTQWVYPRVCGGTLLAVIAEGGRRGLSPRVRGNPKIRAWYEDYQGSIPACAGEPAGRSIGKRIGKVYPRVCGGTSSATQGLTTAKGLSPRVRGNRRASCRRPPRSRPRSIPACAGEPPSCPSSAWERWVYPRVCGGTGLTISAKAFVGGLSPRVRGNLISD